MYSIYSVTLHLLSVNTIIPWYIFPVSPKLEKKFPGYISLRLEDELRKKLEEIASAEDRSVGYIARALIRDGLASHEKKSSKKKKPA